MGADLLALLSENAEYKRVASTHGGEHAGPCPFCGGRDRFRVWPEEGNYWCRQCGKNGDAIQLLRERDGMTFRDACAAVGKEAHRAAQPRFAPTVLMPDRDWRNRAMNAVQSCEEALWKKDGERAREWLASRGLREEVLRRYHVGYSKGVKVAGHAIQRGIVIPWFEDGDVVHLKVRRPVSSGSMETRYVSVRGGHPGLYGRDQRQCRSVLVLTEGEMDCLLLAQEAADIADVWTFGSAGARPSAAHLWPMTGYADILIAYDCDDAGNNGAEQIIAHGLRTMRRAIPPAHPPGKDIGDAFAQGENLRNWIGRLLDTSPAGSV